MRKYAMSITALTFLIPAFGLGQGSMGVQGKISEALQGKHRTEAELARDEDRAPMAALDFIGLRDDMTVIEFLPAAQAYYTKILGPVLVENGHLWTVDNSNTFSGWGEWTTEPEFEMTHQVAIDNNYSRAEGRYVPGEINFGVSEADLFLHFREYHNFNEQDNMRINAKVFDTLKSGGEYVIVDHTRRHMKEETRMLGRREDPIDVVLQVQRAGFVLDRASDMFFEESDDLSQEVGQIPNMTDRFFLVFKKP